MSHLSPLEQELQRRFVLKSRLQAPSGVHRRFLGKWQGQQDSKSLLITCATYPDLPDEAVDQQKQIAEKMKSPGSAVLTRVEDFQFDPDFHWMAVEMPPDIDLRTCLREQQRLPLEHVGWILGRLGEALTAAVKDGWPRFSMDASQVMLNLDTRQVRLLIPDMPLFGFSSLTVSDTLHTMAFSSAAFSSQDTQVPLSSRDYVTPLASLCCEMLGAGAGGGGGQNERFRAIPVLTTHQNTLLRTALAGAQRHSFDNVEEFVSQFLGAGEPAGTHHSHVTHHTSHTAASAPTSHEAAAARTATSHTRHTATQQPPPLPEPPQISPLEAMPAGYQMERELRSVDDWRLCKVKHHSGSEALLTTLDVSKLFGERQRNLTNILQTLKQTPHLSLIRPSDILGDNRSLHIIRPLPGGKTLLDLLRERRTLSRPATARVLAAIHAAYEALWGIVPRRLMATSLDQFWLPQEGNPDTGKSTLLLDASQLVIESIVDPATSGAHPVNHFARLTLSLLGQGGGSLSGAHAERFTPVPELSSEINGVLRRALMPDPGAELTLPWLLSQLTAALAGHTAVAHASRPVIQVPEVLRSQPPKQAVRLRLQPQDATQSILGLVADDTVYLGRASTHADFVAQFRPRSPINDSRTRCISRAQVSAKQQNGQILLRDVGGTNPSLAGSRRLADSEIAQLPQTLVLAGEYPLEIRALKSAYAAPGPAVAGWTAATTKPMRRGACGFKALERGILPFECAWIFTDASLISDASGHFTFDDSSTTHCIARFHHHNGCFWVEATGSSRIMVNGLALNSGDVAPFGEGDDLRFHDQQYTVSSFTPEPRTSA